MKINKIKCHTVHEMIFFLQNDHSYPIRCQQASVVSNCSAWSKLNTEIGLHTTTTHHKLLDHLQSRQEADVPYASLFKPNQKKNQDIFCPLFSPCSLLQSWRCTHINLTKMFLKKKSPSPWAIVHEGIRLHQSTLPLYGFFDVTRVHQSTLPLYGFFDVKLRPLL